MRVWDVTSNVPGLLTTIPFDSGGPGVRLRAVTCLQVSNASLTISWRKESITSKHLLPFESMLSGSSLHTCDCIVETEVSNTWSQSCDKQRHVANPFHNLFSICQLSCQPFTKL